MAGIDYLTGTISRGLKMTARLLSIDDHQTLVSKMERCLTHDQCIDSSMQHALGSVAQWDRRTVSARNAQEDAELHRDPVEFTGDGGDEPPLAWVCLWNGKYANIYGDYVPWPLRRCGYVMWDERRWKGRAVEEVVARQWDMEPALVVEILNDYGWCPVDDSVPPLYR